MRKRFLIWLLATVFLATVHLAHAQQPKKVFRIGYLSSNNPTSESARYRLLWPALRKLGYAEGQNISVERRYAEGKRDRVPELAAELVRLNVDVILAADGDGVIRAAMEATKTIPIILTGPGTDPVRAGFVQSLAQPGGNVTGITILTRELAGKRLELFKDAVPKLSRVGVLYSPGVANYEVKEEIPPAARALKLTIQPWEIRAVDALESVLTALSKEHPHGLYVVGGSTMIRAVEKRVVDFAVKNRLPSCFVYREAVEAGGLMFYQADIAEDAQRIAYFVDRILKGAKPADLPVEQPTKFEFVINLKTAKQIGLTIPPEVLARATRIIR